MTYKEKNARFFKLYNSVQIPLRAYILMMVHNENDAEDILQETAGVLWEKFDKFEPGTNFRAWAYKISKNQALVFLRKKRNAEMQFSEALIQRITGYAEKMSDSSSDRKKALQQCVKKLNQIDQTFLQMRYQKRLTVKEIATQTNRSLNGFYKTLTRIHTVLKKCIDRRVRYWQES